MPTGLLYVFFGEMAIYVSMSFYIIGEGGRGRKERRRESFYIIGEEGERERGGERERKRKEEKEGKKGENGKMGKRISGTF